MNRRESIRALSLALAAVIVGREEAFAAPTKTRMTVYKTRTCGCCKAWVKHAEKLGFEVKAIDVEDVAPYKTKYGVPSDLASCHTAIVGRYTFEGHVPADLIQSFLKKPGKNDRGLAVAGMPLGSPGMEVPGQKDDYDVVLFRTDRSRRVFARR